MKNYWFIRAFGLLLSIALLFGVVACETSSPVTPTAPTEAITETQANEATEINLTPTPTKADPILYLVTGPDANLYSVSQVRAVLEELSEGSGLTLAIEEAPSFEITNGGQVVVSIGEGVDVNNLAVSYPEVVFVSIDNRDATPANNLYVIGDPVSDQQRRSFMAGYLAAVISEDYKIAALVPSEGELTETALESFVVGARFFCGICQSKYPPYQPFPQWETLSLEDLSAENYQAVLEYFNNIGTEVLYVHGDLASSALLTAIADLGIKVVSDRQPEVIRSNFVGTVLSDPGQALESSWPEIMSGGNGSHISSAVALVDLDAGLVSEGRYRVFVEMIEDLQAGLVFPEAVP